MARRVVELVVIAALFLFVQGCSTTTTYLAPGEEKQISAAEEVIVKMNDGTELQLKKASVVKGRLVGYAPPDNKKEEVELSDIRSVRIEKANNTYAYLFVGAAGVVAAWLAVGAAIAPSPPPSSSCPFVYSYDGEKYVFDAEPYGGAICRGLKRTEWGELEHLKEVNGRYRIKVTNEMNETQYVDEMRLVVVDHPKGVKIAPDVSGEIHTFPQPLSPLRSRDSKGRDINALISRRDGVFWQTQVNEMSAAKQENLRDELILQFPKPAAARKAKLLVDVRTTLWGPQIAKRILELYGNKILDWYNEVDSFGPAFQRVISWYFTEELYLLQVRVDTKNGWESKGVIFGGGPFVSREKSYVLDIGDVPGDTLRIKLTPPACFWMLDYLAVDYTDDAPVKVAEVTATEAVDHAGRNVQGLVAEHDDSFLVLPNIGDNVELIFQAPRRDVTLDRSILLKATGYYDIHLAAKGDPQTAVLDRIHNEPGFTLKYASEEYLRLNQGESEKRGEGK